MSYKKLLSGYAWKVGDLVDAKWSDGYYYPGKVEKVNEDSSLVILFDDGDISHKQRKDEVRQRKMTGENSESSDSEIIIIPVEKNKEKPEGIKEKVKTPKKSKKETIKKSNTPKKANTKKNRNFIWNEGDLIEAMWTDGLFYNAVIKRKDIDGQLKILFDDGVYRDIPVERVAEGVRPRFTPEGSEESSEDKTTTNKNNDNNNNNNQGGELKEEIKQLKKKASDLNGELTLVRKGVKKTRRK